MVKISDKVVYRNDICKILSIDRKYKDNEDYLVLSSSQDSTLIIRVPLSVADENIRPLMSKKDINQLIKKIPEIPTIPMENWNRGVEYKELLSDGSHESIISVIKTSHLRQQAKTDKKQKVNEIDKIYFRQAEQRLYREIAAVLNISYEAAKKYIIDSVAALSED